MRDREMFMGYTYPNQMPNYPNNYQNGYPIMQNDLENRVSALERMVKRLDAKISSITNNTNDYNSTIDNVYPNNMYML